MSLLTLGRLQVPLSLSRGLRMSMRLQHAAASGLEGVPASWLRDACQCEKCVHPSTRQKLFSTGSLTSAAGRIETDGPAAIWEKGSVASSAITADLRSERHSARFDPHFVARFKDQFVVSRLGSSDPLGSSGSTPIRTNHNSHMKTWIANHIAALPHFDYRELSAPSNANNADKTLLALLSQLHSHGLAFVKNVPTDEADQPEKTPQLETIIQGMGCVIRDSFYGRTWNVKSVRQARNIAYTSLDLGLHMDLLYFESPPGIQFLHSLKNSVTGGNSIFLDSYKAAQILKQESPQHFKTLTETPLTYHYDNDGHLMKQHRYTISENNLNSDAPNGMHVFYSPPFQGPLEHVHSEAQMQALIQAVAAFEDVMRRPDMMFEIRLEAGMMVVFHNLRVLHGRREFDAESGERHFKGAYVDYDVMKDRLAVLSRAMNPQTV